MTFQGLLGRKRSGYSMNTSNTIGYYRGPIRVCLGCYFQSNSSRHHRFEGNGQSLITGVISNSGCK